MSRLVVCAWHTECGDCGYGSGGWSASPALEGRPILTPESDHCPGCGTDFDNVVDEWGDEFHEEDEDDGEATDSREE